MTGDHRVPTSLSPGDLVGVVAPGFAVRPRSLDDGLAALSRMGYSIRLGRHVRSRDGYLAGSDDERLADLVAALSDPDLDAVWFARGGYGTARLLDRIPWRKLRRGPRVLIGYSDLTALFGAVDRFDRWRCLYGPVVTELGDPAAYQRASLRATLAGDATTMRYRASQVVCGGRATGRLVGGNLSVLVHLIGTRHAPRFDGAILVLEDVGEPVYRIDRMLTHLAMAGVFRRVAGICLGRFDAPRRRRFPPDRALEDVLSERFEPLAIPVVRDLPFGHVARKRTVPLGGTATLDVGSRTVRFAP